MVCLQGGLSKRWVSALPRVCFCSGANGRAAALTMYQRARKLEALMVDASAFAELADLQLEAYVVAMNALALVDSKSQWVTLPIVGEAGREVRASLHRVVCSFD